MWDAAAPAVDADHIEAFSSGNAATAAPKLADLQQSYQAMVNEVNRRKQELKNLQTELTSRKAAVVQALLAPPSARLSASGHADAAADVDADRDSAACGNPKSPQLAAMMSGLPNATAHARALSAGPAMAPAMATTPSDDMPQPQRPNQPDGRHLWNSDALHQWQSYKLHGAGDSTDKAAATCTARPTPAQSGDDAATCALQTLLYTSLERDAYAGVCEVRGVLPPWLHGTVYRTGPGLWECGTRQLKHEYDGFPIVGAIRFGHAAGAPGTASAGQRFIDDEPYRAARRGVLVVDKFASRRKFTTWADWAQDRLRSVTGSRFSEPAGMNTAAIGDKVVAFFALAPGRFCIIDPDTLCTTEKTFTDRDKLNIDACAPFVTPDPFGEPYTLGTTIGSGMKIYKYIPLGQSSLARVEVSTCTFKTRRIAPCFTPCVGNSLKYYVFPELPLFANLNRAMGLSKTDSDDDDDTKDSYYMFDWMPKEGIRLHTLDKATGRQRAWDLPQAWWCWYFCNVFDTEDGWLVIDAAIYEKPIHMKLLSIRKRRVGPIPGNDLAYNQLMRIRIPVGDTSPDAQISMTQLCPPKSHGSLLQENTIDPRRAGRQYRFIFGNCIGSPRPCNAVRAVCKIDVLTGSVALWQDPQAIIAGKSTYVSRPGAAEDDEEDAVLIADCLHADGHAFYAVLDVRSFTEIARVVLPHRHCVSREATWVPFRSAGAH